MQKRASHIFCSAFWSTGRHWRAPRRIRARRSGSYASEFTRIVALKRQGFQRGALVSGIAVGSEASERPSITPPFRAGHFGAIVRHCALMEPRAKRGHGEISAAQLAQGDDPEARKIIKKREAVGPKRRPTVSDAVLLKPTIRRRPPYGARGSSCGYGSLIPRPACASLRDRSRAPAWHKVSGRPRP
jgi:hypothetical protein